MAISTKNQSKHQSSLTKKTTGIALVILTIVISIPVLLYQQQDNLSGALVGAINPNPFHTDNNAEEPHSFPLTGNAVENILSQENINIKSIITKSSAESISNNTISSPVDVTLHSFAGRISVEDKRIILEGNVKDITTHSK